MIPLAILYASRTPTYEKLEFRIPMRDGVRLYTAVYVPQGVADAPMLLERTPYSAGPYGPGKMRDVAGEGLFAQKGYIFVYQDVRGRYQSEGEWENVRPLRRFTGAATDEATDTYDTAEYLVRNVPRSNGKIGVWGVSYPGFYASMAALSGHPGVRAVSPQAPVADWFMGDDVYHRGAFFLQDNFDFSIWFDVPRKELEEEHEGLPPFERGPGGPYGFFLRNSPNSLLERNVIRGRIPYWTEILTHDTYDSYWKARALPDKMAEVKPAVLTVGGWYDAEDLYGALHVYGETERRSRTANHLVMGPWTHGMWRGGPGRRLAGLDFGQDTGPWFREQVEFPFFERWHSRWHGRGV